MLSGWPRFFAALRMTFAEVTQRSLATAPKQGIRAPKWAQAWSKIDGLCDSCRPRDRYGRAQKRAYRL